MAKTKNGILDGFEGRLGTVIGYQWKGIECMRAVNSFPHDPKTQAQLNCRSLFRTLSQLGSDMLPAARIGFRGPADAGHTTEYNCFVRANKQCVTLVDGEIQIDYPALRLSDGPLEEVVFGEPHIDDTLHLSVTFSSTPNSHGSDYVLLYTYVPCLRQGFLAQPACRRQHKVESTLPSFWRGHKVQLYGFCWDSDLTASPSKYLGTYILQ